MYFQKMSCLLLFVVGVSLQAEEYFPAEKIAAHLASYDEKAREDVAKDLKVVRSVCRVKEAPTKDHPFYLGTAGGPGSRKSTISERFIQQNPIYQSGVKLDPDWVLKLMVHTYQAQSLNALKVASSPNYLDVLRAGYETWRGASNYITLTLIEEVLQKKADLIHGTTSTGAHVEELFQKLKKEGYHITLLLCYCEDEIRKQAMEYRASEQRAYQSSPEDGKIFVEKLSLYFKYADSLYLYWSDDVLAEERRAAIFDKGEMIVEEGCFCALDSFMDKFGRDRNVLQAEGKSIPSWEELVQLYLGRFQKIAL